MFVLKDITHFSKMLKFKKNEDGKVLIWDQIRKKWLVNQPEELVRQIIFLQLTQEYGYPKSRFQAEKGLKIYDNKGRFDLLLYDWEVKPFIVIECKAFDYKLNALNYSQLAIYNERLDAPFICLTNGIVAACYQRIENKYVELENFPEYPAK